MKLTLFRLVFTGVCAGLLLMRNTVQARIFNIANTNDAIKEHGLRSAIIEANRIGGNNTIILNHPAKQPRQRVQSVFRLKLDGANENKAKTGDLDITRGNLTIRGADKNVVIDATGLGDRVFQVSPKARLTLVNLVITGGTAPGDNYGSVFDSAETGGAICNAGTLTMQNCAITGNSSGPGNSYLGNGGGGPGADGGGIYNSGTMTLTSCVVSGNAAGAGKDGASGGNGGGIHNSGSCQLLFCVLGGNASGDGAAPSGNAFGFAGSGGNGGAINNSGRMTLTGCTVSNNFTGVGKNGGQPGIGSVGNLPGAPGGNGGDGAGIYNSGSLPLNFCTFNANLNGDGGQGGGNDGFKHGSGGKGGSGAGVFSIGSVSINSCTISGNRCGNGGDGGIGFPCGGDGGEGGSGAGIYNAGSLTLFSVTVAGNVSGAGGAGGEGRTSMTSGIGGDGGNGGCGGGILNVSSNADMVCNTLIALNTAGLGGAGGLGFGGYSSIFNYNEGTNGVSGLDNLGPNLAGDFTSQGFNLISIADDSNGFANEVNSDKVGNGVSPIDPLLGPLQINGGPTPTHALLPGSPAIDQGKSFGARIDQRSRHRPFNYPAVPNSLCGDGSDIGAFEANP